MELAEDGIDDRVVLLSGIVKCKREDEKSNWRDPQWIEWPALQIVPYTPQPAKDIYIPGIPDDVIIPAEIERPN